MDILSKIGSCSFSKSVCMGGTHVFVHDREGLSNPGHYRFVYSFYFPDN
jgi:hypothetical protein